MHQCVEEYLLFANYKERDNFVLSAVTPGLNFALYFIASTQPLSFVYFFSWHFIFEWCGSAEVCRKSEVKKSAQKLTSVQKRLKSDKSDFQHLLWLFIMWISGLLRGSERVYSKMKLFRPMRPDTPHPTTYCKRLSVPWLPDQLFSSHRAQPIVIH